MTRPRLLPATMAVAAVLLVSKGVGVGLALLPAVAVVAKAEAAPTPEHGHAPARAVPVTPAPPPGPSVVGQPAPSGPPQPSVSEGERRLLQDLRSRRQELDTRERTLTQREGVLDAAEQRLSARITQLSTLQARLEQLDRERREHDEANWTGLVKVYETMKPREAAAIFNDMDMPVLLGVLDRMKDAKAASVLGAMQPDRARLATAQLAAQRTHATTVPPARSDAG